MGLASFATDIGAPPALRAPPQAKAADWLISSGKHGAEICGISADIVSRSLHFEGKDAGKWSIIEPLPVLPPIASCWRLDFCQ
jgi:hypothetical protein